MITEDLLIKCDSLLSLIRHRESLGLSDQTIRDLDELLPRLRHETDLIIERNRALVRNDHDSVP